jgi:hypothetical protein
MVSSTNCMEPDLETIVAHKDDLLDVAAYYACDAQALCADVSAMVFPAGHMAPSEEMLTAVATKMRAMILGIENRFRDQAQTDPVLEPECWKLLMHSGFLREPGLMDFVLARFAEDRLNARIASQGETPLMEQLPAQLLSNGDPEIADAAQAILLSETTSRRAPQLVFQQLPPELLHQLVWRIVAALQILSGTKNDAHMHSAKSMLAAHDEVQISQVAARKIVHFIGTHLGDDALNPQKAGLAIFIATVSARTGLDQDHILRLIDGHSSAPFAILLRACSVHRDAAMAAICLFKGFLLTPYEINLFDSNYTKLDVLAAQAALNEWSQARLKYLAFSDVTGSGV